MGRVGVGLVVVVLGVAAVIQAVAKLTADVGAGGVRAAVVGVTVAVAVIVIVAAAKAKQQRQT